MLTAVAIVGWALLLAIAVPNAVIAIELFAGARPRTSAQAFGALPDTVVVIPAHDEAAGIAAILERILETLPGGMRLMVVADNCTDDTAMLARAALARATGAEVTERNDPARRGKGHALAHGRAALAARPPAVVIVLDADCVPEPGALARIARGAAATGRPVQASYLLEPRPAASPMIQISGFAFLVKNLVRQAGLARIGAPAVLTGSGMAFPWARFAEAPLATDDIVEDLAIGIALARSGSSPRFDPGATIWTAPAGGSGTLGQRTRWEHGFVATARRVALPLIAEGLRCGRPGLIWLGLHIAVPPLALLLGIDGAVLGALAIAWGLGASAIPLVAGLLLVGLVGSGVLLAWSRHGRGQVGPAALARAPLYFLWKIPIYLRLVRRTETRWVRTERNEDG